jgi:hypothetical protein
MVTEGLDVPEAPITEAAAKRQLQFTGGKIVAWHCFHLAQIPVLKLAPKVTRRIMTHDEVLIAETDTFAVTAVVETLAITVGGSGSIGGGDLNWSVRRHPGRT